MKSKSEVYKQTFFLGDWLFFMLLSKFINIKSLKILESIDLLKRKSNKLLKKNVKSTQQHSEIVTKKQPI